MSNLAAALSPSPVQALPLRSAHLRARAEGGIVRFELEQRFANPHAEPLHLTYKLPLPEEAAVVGFRFEIGDRTIVGEVDTKAKARERFDDAIVSGHTAALLEEERSTLFTQEIGNVPPGTEVVAKVTIDAQLVFAAMPGRGQWELRFPLTAAPRYLGESGRVADASALVVGLRGGEAEAPRIALALDVGDRLPEGRSPESPSHALQCARAADGSFGVSLGGSGEVPLDRDLVVRWDAAAPAASVTAVSHVAHDEDAAYVLVTVVPPAEPVGMSHPRDLTILLDTSGSMGGEPLEQARRVARALVDRLGPADTVHLVEFSNDTRSFRPSAMPATPETKREALAWLGRLRASGGTEMRTGILRALGDVRPGRSAQVILVTDGLIGFEQEIVSAIYRDNVQGARVHTVGVGSAVNRSLLAPAARAGRGLEIVCGVGEDVEPLVTRLLARTGAPIVTGLEVRRVSSVSPLEVSCATEKLLDLHAASPSLVPVRLPREGGTLRLTGRTREGEFQQEIHVVPDGVARPHVRALYGREAVRDVELRLAAGALGGSEAARETERLGLAFGIVTKETSFVAVDSLVTVDPTRASRHESVAHALPFGMSAEGAGLRPASVTVLARASAPAAFPMAPPPPPAGRSASGGAPPPRPPASAGAPRRERAKVEDKESAPSPAPKKKAEAPAPSLLERAKRIVFGPPADKGAPPPPAPAPVESADRADREAREEHVAAPKAEAEEGARARLRARLRRVDGTRVVVELHLDAETELRNTRVLLVLADGTRIEVTLDRTLSTAEGTYGAGMILRFVGVLPEGTALAPRDVSGLRVETAAGTLEATF